MTKREQLIRDIEGFCQTKGISEREFAEIATRNPKFVIRLRRNAVTSRLMDEADLFLAEHAEASPMTLKIMVAAHRARGSALVAA